MEDDVEDPGRCGVALFSGAVGVVGTALRLVKLANVDALGIGTPHVGRLSGRGGGGNGVPGGGRGWPRPIGPVCDRVIAGD